MIDPQAITEAVWAARGPSLWTRKPGDDAPPRVGPDEPPKQTRAMVPGSTHKLLVDVEGIVAMRREGYEWREIASRFDVSVNTCRDRVQRIAPDLLPMRRKAVKS